MNGQGKPNERRPLTSKSQETVRRFPTRVGPGAEDMGDVEERPFPAGGKKESWVQENSTLVKGIAAGVVLIVLFILLAWQMGWFGSKANKPVAVNPPPAEQPAPPRGADVPQPAPAEAPPPANVPPPEIQPPGPLPQPAPGMQPSPEQAPPAEQPKVEEKPPLPEDVKDWKKDDFLRARREYHPKLIQAIEYVGKTFPNSEDVAKGLIEMLKPLPPEQPTPEGGAPPAPNGPGVPPGMPPQPGMPPAQPEIPPAQPGMPLQPGAPPPMPAPVPGAPPQALPFGQQPYAPTDKAALVDAIVSALGNNRTEPAQQTIEQILAGTFQTEDDKTAVESALKVLVAHPSEKNDSLLLRLLTEPEAVRPLERQGPWPAKDLQNKALELVKQAASYQLRTKLGEYLVGRHVRIDPKEPLHELLWASNPLNCAAQLAFYLHGNIDKELKPTLEQQLLYYSSLAMRRSLGIPDDFQSGTSTGGMPMGPMMPGVPPALPPPALPPAQPFNPGASTPSITPANVPSNAEITAWLAGRLWSEEFQPELTSQLGSQSLERQARLYLLAGCIPHDSVRSALAKALRKRWNDGPSHLETAGFLDWVITDPGLVPVIKMLPRKDYAANTALGGRTLPPTPAAGGRVAEAVQKKQQTEQDWMNCSSKLVSAWCKRLTAAAEARQKAAQEAGQAQELSIADAKLPEGFEVKSDARVVSFYRLKWPDELPESLSAVNVSPLEVIYLRLEEINRPRKAVSFYTRQAQARTSDVRNVNNSNKDFWIDNVRAGSQKDRRRSIDILITTPTNYKLAPNPRDEDEADLVVEILIIEIKAPPRD